MNFLAHIYLSGEDDMVRIGNFAADGIRGNRYKTYPENMQKGILLHRAIDTYTDAHPIVRQSTRRLHMGYSHYSSVVIDIFYDHFLAKNWQVYAGLPLPDYAENFYHVLNRYWTLLPERTQYLAPFMIRDNWLVAYASMKGIAKVLHQMNRRTRFPSKINYAVLDLDEYYEEFEDEFNLFFPELIQYSQQKLQFL
ncbi:acyl carrier protein phosphodiesterase [Ascidiimonas aurantiaca]|uniref:acyl carrier protein phosphodiesterase n=1 Tax=Ascidiimonas aurantiaca TaxID=1685432 RepID=UPI0030EC9DA9